MGKFAVIFQALGFIILNSVIWNSHASSEKCSPQVEELVQRLQAYVRAPDSHGIVRGSLIEAGTHGLEMHALRQKGSISAANVKLIELERMVEKFFPSPDAIGTHRVKAKLTVEDSNLMVQRFHALLVAAGYSAEIKVKSHPENASFISFQGTRDNLLGFLVFELNEVSKRMGEGTEIRVELFPLRHVHQIDEKSVLKFEMDSRLAIPEGTFVLSPQDVLQLLKFQGQKNGARFESLHFFKNWIGALGRLYALENILNKSRWSLMGLHHLDAQGETTQGALDLIDQALFLRFQALALRDAMNANDTEIIGSNSIKTLEAIEAQLEKHLEQAKAYLERLKGIRGIVQKIFSTPEKGIRELILEVNLDPQGFDGFYNFVSPGQSEIVLEGNRVVNFTVYLTKDPQLGVVKNVVRYHFIFASRTDGDMPELVFFDDFDNALVGNLRAVFKAIELTESEALKDKLHTDASLLLRQRIQEIFLAESGESDHLLGLVERQILLTTDFLGRLRKLKSDHNQNQKSFPFEDFSQGYLGLTERLQRFDEINDIDLGETQFN